MGTPQVTTVRLAHTKKLINVAGLPENHQVIGKYFEMMSGMIGEDNVLPER